MKDKLRRFPLWVFEFHNGELMTATGYYLPTSRYYVVMPFRHYDPDGQRLELDEVVALPRDRIKRNVRIEELENVLATPSYLRAMLELGKEVRR